MKKKRSLFRRALPHFTIAFMLCIDTLQVFHMFNPGWGFLSSIPSVVLITAGTVCGIISAVALIRSDEKESDDS